MTSKEAYQEWLKQHPDFGVSRDEFVWQAAWDAKEKQDLACVEAEPELPGDMPDDVWELYRQLKGREEVAEMLRIVVRGTKRCIVERIEGAK